MPISDELIDQLLEGCNSPRDILGETGLHSNSMKSCFFAAQNSMVSYQDHVTKLAVTMLIYLNGFKRR